MERIANILTRLLITGLLIWSGRAVLFETVALEISSEKTVGSLLAALEWAPDLPELHFALGLVYRDDLHHLDPSASRRHLETATHLNPLDWYYWRELSRLYESTGDEASTERAVMKGLEIYPKSAAERWRLGNFYLRQGDAARAVEQIGQSARLDPEYQGPALITLSKAGLLSELLGQKDWPQDPDSLLLLLRFLAEHEDQPSEVVKLWARFVAARGSAAPDPENIEFYLQYLGRQKQYGQIRREWVRIRRLSGRKDPSYEADRTHVWNGDFKLELLPGFLEWEIIESPHFRVDQYADATPDKGNALRIEFFGTDNLTDVMHQRIAVEAGQTYTFRYIAKGEDLTTGQGPYFEVQGPGISARTDHVVGTTGWEERSVRFQAGQEGLLVLRMKRQRSEKIDNKIRGIFWLANVRLER